MKEDDGRIIRQIIEFEFENKNIPGSGLSGDSYKKTTVYQKSFRCPKLPRQKSRAIWKAGDTNQVLEFGKWMGHFMAYLIQTAL